MKLFLDNSLGLTPVLLVLAGVLAGGFMQLGAVSGSAAGLILAAVEGRKGGFRELLGRAGIWRVGIQWWTFALFSFVPFILVGLYLFRLLGGPAVDWSGLAPLGSAVQMLVILIIFAEFGEEFGWRGFLLPRLQARHNALVSTLIVWVVHSLWHIPLFLIPGMTQYLWVQEVGFFTAYFGYVAGLLGWTIMYTWVFNNTRGSVLLAAVMHGMGNFWAGYLDNYRGVYATSLVFGVVLLVVAFIIVLLTGPENLSRKHKRNVLELEEG